MDCTFFEQKVSRKGAMAQRTDRMIIAEVRDYTEKGDRTMKSLLSVMDSLRLGAFA